MNTQDEIYKKIKSYDKKILDFDSGENNFKPAHYPPKEEGLYITIRCGLAGISQTLDRYKDGVWQLRVLDGSKVIAYSKNKVNEDYTFGTSTTTLDGNTSATDGKPHNPSFTD